MGAEFGATVGTLIMPGIGTLVGGIGGAVYGGIQGGNFGKGVATGLIKN